MHRPVVLCSVVAAALLAAAGCGPAKSAVSGKSADQAVQDAVRQAQSSPLHMSLKGNLGVDRSRLSNVPPEIESALGSFGNGGNATAELDQESATRRKLTVKTGGKDVTVVQYDGKAYYSEDGTRYAEVTGAAPTQTELSKIDLGKLVSAFSFEDRGGEKQQDGRSVEHYRAPVTVAALQKLAGNLGASASQVSQLQQALAVAGPFTRIDRGGFDVWLSADNGSLARLDLSGAGAVDVGGLVSAISQGLGSAAATALPAVRGSLGLKGELDARVSQPGGGVHVSRPSPDPTAATPEAGHGYPGGSGATPSPTP